MTEVVIDAPKQYLIPQAWREVIERLEWNGVALQRVQQDQTLSVEAYYIDAVGTRGGAYEGHMFHDELRLSSKALHYAARAGDVLVPLDQAAARYCVETLEPQAHDSFFRWGFFNSVLEKKENFSDYVFEDTALQMLEEEPALRAAFARWKAQHPEMLIDQQAVLSFIYAHGARHAEPEWRRYPVLRVV